MAESERDPSLADMLRALQTAVRARNAEQDRGCLLAVLEFDAYVLEFCERAETRLQHLMLAVNEIDRRTKGDGHG